MLAYFEKKNSIHNQKALVIHYEKTQGVFFLKTFPKKDLTSGKKKIITQKQVK